MTRLRMAVVGVGHLGKEHARILASLPEVDLVGVADTHFEQAQTVAKRVGTQAYAEYWPLLNMVDAVCVAVPTTYHEPVASEFLRRGISTLVEKPLAPSHAACDRLVALADKTNALLSVGHIERFNPAFEEIVRRPMQPKYVRAERLGPFTGRSGDIGVVLDLMIHDLDVILALVRDEVAQVEALGISVFGKHEDIANARVRFKNGCIADITASRSHPTPHRAMQIWSPEGFAGIDFGSRRVSLVQPSAELRAEGLDAGKLDPASRARIKEDLFGRHLHALVVDGQAQDQLTHELKHFVHCVKHKTTPRVTGAAGRDAVALAERILDSIRSHSWTGESAGPRGPLDLPAALPPLFVPAPRQEVA